MGEASYQSQAKERFTVSRLSSKIPQQTTMTQTEINQAIKNALDNLNNLNQQVCDYWLSELHDENDEVIEEAWNENNLNLMEKDVMYNS